MSLRDRFKRFREDWESAGERLADWAEHEERRERKRAAEKARRVAGGECDQIGCSRGADRDGKCGGCWAAIFGGVA